VPRAKVTEKDYPRAASGLQVIDINVQEVSGGGSYSPTFGETPHRRASPINPSQRAS